MLLLFLEEFVKKAKVWGRGERVHPRVNRWFVVEGEEEGKVWWEKKREEIEGAIKAEQRGKLMALFGCLPNLIFKASSLEASTFD